MGEKVRGVNLLFLLAVLAMISGCGNSGKVDNPEKPEQAKRTEQAANIAIKEGESIAEAVKKAKAGWIIDVEPGVYKETIQVDKHNITLRGVVKGKERPVLDGENKLNDGVLASGNNFTMTGFEIRNYKGNGVTTQGSDGVTLTDLVVVNAGLYGLFPVESKNVLIENNSVTGIKDAGIYVGECEKSVVRNNKVFMNVAGIELENSSHAVVEDNDVHDNTGGILVFVLPGKIVKVGEDNIIRNNRVINNNTKNFGDPKSIVGKVPSGTGILIMAADRTVVSGNEIKNNQSFGVAMVELGVLEDMKKDEKVEPNSDGTQILNNVYEKNGTAPQGMVKEMLGKGADIIWSGTGKDNCARKPKGVTMVGAEALPDCKATAMSGEEKAPVEEKKKEQDAGKGGETIKSVEAQSKGVKVEMAGMTIKPMHIKIKVGETVTWVNKDNVTHSVVTGVGPNPDEKPVFDSGFMAPKAVFSYTFTKPGKYTYLCLPHRYQAPMRDATVTVTK